MSFSSPFLLFLCACALYMIVCLICLFLMSISVLFLSRGLSLPHSDTNIQWVNHLFSYSLFQSILSFSWSSSVYQTCQFIYLSISIPQPYISTRTRTHTSLLTHALARSITHSLTCTVSSPTPVYLSFYLSIFPFLLSLSLCLCQIFCLCLNVCLFFFFNLSHALFVFK